METNNEVNALKIRVFDLSEAFTQTQAQLNQMNEALQVIIKELGIENENVTLNEIVTKIKELSAPKVETPKETRKPRAKKVKDEE